MDLDVLQILEIDDVKFTVSFSMYFGVRYNKQLSLTPNIMIGKQMVGAEDRGSASSGGQSLCPHRYQVH